MKSTALTYRASFEKNKIELTDFCNEATKDHEFWSRDFNMHFGYFIPFKTNPFKRDSMLNEMNNQVIHRLDIVNTKKSIIDLGCGMGASMRFALKKNKNLSAFGVTLSNLQVEKGNELIKDLNGTILKEDYNHTSFPSNSFDAELTIESFCHSGHNKNAIKETYRILKPKGKLVITDAFLKKEEDSLCFGSKIAYQKLCNHWSLEKLETIENMAKNLNDQGYLDITVDDASFKVAPSVLHVPFAILGFLLKNLYAFKTLKKESFHNLKGSFYALLSGIHMKNFGYYIITCTKP